MHSRSISLNNQRDTFRELEAAAWAGYLVGWFRLGRDYEVFGDSKHVQYCFERDAEQNSERCLFRLGMAYQLEVDYMRGVSMVHKAATRLRLRATLTLRDLHPRCKSLQIYLGHWYRPGCVPAQYKLGHCYEFAETPDSPLLIVQYYSLAEVDVALSKWFLCGSEGSEGGSGGFAKDETLTCTFAEKAAKKGLAAVEFAMGYITEVVISTMSEGIVRESYCQGKYTCTRWRPLGDFQEMNMRGSQGAAW